MTACHRCGYRYDLDALGKHGCPNCCGEAVRRTVVYSLAGSCKMGTIKAATTADAKRKTT